MPIWQARKHRRNEDKSNMIVQHFLTVRKDICSETDLYVKSQKGKITFQGEAFCLEKEGTYSFFTYFNSFSIEKWIHYTDIRDFCFRATISGEGEIRLCQAILQDSTMMEWEVLRQSFGQKQSGEICMPVPKEVQEGIVYIQVVTKTDTVIEGARYETTAEPKKNINIAAGICTYRREEYVKKTLQNLQQAYFSDADSPLYGHLKIYVSDNGQTLSCDSLNNEHVRCVPNKNAGGAGGFTRAMLEALKEQEEKQFTHFLFMDDDIALEPEVLYRTYAMLSLVSGEYEGAAVGGALLQKDKPWMQHASGEVWEPDRVQFTKRGYDMRRPEDLLKNEKIVPVDYNGWWYYCVPFSGQTANQLPLPFFIHVDDIEYGLRFDGTIIYCNGIGVWHDAFQHRKASSMEYYDMRNLLIMNALRRPKYTWKQARKRVCKHLIYQCLKYRYADGKLTLRGVEDYCRGIDFLKTTDPVKLHQEIIEAGYAWTEQNLEEVEIVADDTADVSKHSLKQLLTANGWLLPATRPKEKAVPMGASIAALYRVKKVIYYEPETGKGFKTERRYREVFSLLKNMHQASKLLRKNYDRVAAEYRAREQEITNREFWKEYLE